MCRLCISGCWKPTLISIIHIFLAATSLIVNGDVFTVGYLTGSQRKPGTFVYDRPGYTISGAIALATDEINAPNGIFGRNGHRMEFIWAETYGEEEMSIFQTAELWTKNITAYIGPQETCYHEGRMAAAFQLPMISYFCTDHATSDKHLFPTFARTRPPDNQISKSVAAVLKYFEWNHVVFLYLNSTDDDFGKVAATILDTFKTKNINVGAVRTWNTLYHHRYMKNPFYQILEETAKDTRIYVILGYYYEHLGLLVAMEDMELLKDGRYFVVGVDIEQYDPTDPSKYLRGFLTDDRDPYAERAFRAYFSVTPSSPPASEYENFSNSINTFMEKPPFYFKNPLNFMKGTTKARSEAAYLYDAVHLYARAIIEVIESNGNPRNSSDIMNVIRESRYKSAMGYMVYMDENGDAEGNYTLLGRQMIHDGNNTNPFNPRYGLFPIGVFTHKSRDTQLPVLHLTDKISWVGGRPPIAVLPCGFRNEKCISYTGEIVAGFTGGFAVFLLIIMLVLYRNWRYEQELDSLLWKIDFKEIEIHDENNPSSANINNGNITNGGLLVQTTNPTGGKITRAYHPLIRTSQVSLSSNPDADFRYSSIFTKIGIYKGRIYAIKKVYKKSVDITREMKKELKMMRDLRHNNLNAFIGACTEPPNICIITEYCSRGSLKDILENEEVKLDNMFVASIVADILRGMIYLHDSPVRFHGALCTSNCLVDSRWVVKVADFGLHEFKRGADESQKYANEHHSSCTSAMAKCEVLLYKAPEILRITLTTNSRNSVDAGTTGARGSLSGSSGNGGSNPSVLRGTQKGDVYSFSIILFELHSRHGPFGETELTPAEILQRVIHPSMNNVLFRPNLESLETSFDFVIDCLKECWAEDPDDRPDFKTVRTKLRPLRKGMKPNIFDNMMAMMEKYANNLEVLVDERTDQLQEEKKKTEALLLEMLPRPVAEQLKRGNKVEAENFDCVTIYFSDIVGFTSMSAESTPLQVVDFLNDLYTCFDSIIENYDVYKVETIGDAYMVVSGLPIRNGDQHAAEIATMSLHLLSAVTQFTIRHRPNEQLKLRIGIHSGPVCAGVVGLKMPRYCLFGDTVNTASRMESTGLPLKIHCSKDCKDLLDKLEGYTMESRGYVEMKGKGEQLTYWLTGEEEAKRMKRSEERCARRLLQTGKPCRNGHSSDLNNCVPGIPRSSLKNKNALTRSPLPRCSSLESPKRLRFASGDRLELFHHKQPLLEVISDNSPIKKSSGSLLETSIDCCSSDAFKTSSSSCPCIENIANSNATLALQDQLFLTLPNDKICSSVPTLICPKNQNHNNNRFKIINSAPSSPRQTISRLALDTQFLTVPFLGPTDFVNASTPLLSYSSNGDMSLNN